jgi:hypothetical protein
MDYAKKSKKLSYKRSLDKKLSNALLPIDILYVYGFM